MAKKCAGGPSFLYIISFYGTPPFNYFERILRGNNVDMTIFTLPVAAPKIKRFGTKPKAIYKDGAQKELNVSFWFPFPLALVYPTQYIINLYAFIYFLIYGKLTGRLSKFDFAVGEANFNGALAALLKILRLVTYSVFLDGDIIPLPTSDRSLKYLNTGNIPLLQVITRATDTILIHLQVLLRKISLLCDLTWYYTKRTRTWDVEHNFLAKDYIIVLAIAVDFEETLKNIAVQKDESTLAYIGRLNENNGIDITIQSLKLIKKRIPDIKLHMVGGSEIYVEKYKKMAKELDVAENIHFYGIIPENEKAYKILVKAKLGLALYKPSMDNTSNYTEPSKPKDYIKLGIPVVSAKEGPIIGKELAQNNAGIEVDFEPAAISEDICDLLTNPIKYNALRQGVIDYAKKADYRKPLNFLYSEMLRRSKYVK